ncbi:hypothetical protein CIL05_06910 [Virgibacillus profundi]|uniref:Uncharacterized protein n=1 Tax=Virgibacillus profundi TaxID=2024555 RepID=A0A2A2IDW0_9BACI|nr:hypothetical protein [Virgibacillus profundi]PAV30191.1 hypothetical protein CIL05_06910 [Virgibacillus profundi]PXY54363.1 hypothetical protein CIT14_06995 [Virgibacillus profundi]
MEISITRSLSEIKMLNKRISRKISDSIFGGYSVGKKVMTGYDTKEDLEQTVKSDFDSVNDLIARRNEVKSAIVMSNATTKVEIAGVKYTVAEAIERKSSIEYEEHLLNRLKNTYTQIVSRVDDVNDDMNRRLDKHLETLFSKEAKTDVQQTDSVVKSFKEQNEAKLIDPIGLKTQIEKLEQKIEDFLTEVDHVLSTSNAITTINVSE